MRPLLLLALALVAVSCRYPHADEHFGLVKDEDGDGFNSDVDCDDEDEDVNPDADEVCNGVDDDCDEEIDVDAIDPSTFWVDVDGDDFGDNEEPTVSACTEPEGYAPVGGDCDDDDKDFHPGAQEIPDDDLDQDCNGDDTIACFKDEDKDGFGAETVTVFAEDGSCDTADGESGNNDDCLDTNSNAHPGGTEVPGDGIDQDCSGADAPPCWADLDGDGFGDVGAPIVVVTCDGDGQATNDDDCEDAYATVFPGASESCDGFPSDCADWTNATTPGAPPANEIDDDDDGYVECTFASGINAGNWGNDEATDVTGGGDCADAYPTVNPDPDTEACDGFPSDCDDWTNFTTPGARPGDEVDDDDDTFVECTFASGITAGNWGNTESPAVAGGGDCNDAVGTGDNDGGAVIYPSAPEICDGRVNACGGSLPLTEVDNDGDTVVDCTFASGVNAANWGGPSSETPITDDQDCNDANAQTYPGAVELCDGADNDCDSSFTDEAGQVSFQPPSGPWVDKTAAVKHTTSRGAYTAEAAGTLWLCDGTYYTTITIPTTITTYTIEGRNGAATTILSGAQVDTTTPDDVVLLTSGTGTGSLTLRGLTVRHGTANSSGAGVRFTGSPTAAVLEDCVIENNVTSSNGAGVYLSGGNLDVLGTTLTGNTAGTDGGNLYVNAGTLDFDANSVAETGTADRGGGIYVKAGTANINGTIEDNDANAGDKFGGGLYVESGTVDLDGAVVTLNTATENGGGVYVLAGTVTGDDVQISTNSAKKGGGLYAAGGTLTFDLLAVEDNVATGDKGGGGVALANASLTASACTFVRNDALTNNADGGALLMDDNTVTATASFTDCVIGGSLVDQNAAEDKGGAFACRQECTITATDTLITHNTGEGAGAVYLNAATGSFTCTATQPGLGVVEANVATGDPEDAANFTGGVLLGGAALTTLVTSNGCDWGTGADDNVVDSPTADPVPADVGSAAYREASFGAGASFTCTTAACVSAGND